MRNHVSSRPDPGAGALASAVYVRLMRVRADSITKYV